MRRTGYSDRLEITSRPGELFAIPLDEAWYCESCRVILNDLTCFCCASGEHTHRLAPWLDREPEIINIPATGVFLTVIPASKKRPQKADRTPPAALPHTSRGRGRAAVQHVDRRTPALKTDENEDAGEGLSCSPCMP